MRAYYINLARRPDRRATMERRFGELGIACERIEAATPADITPEQRARYCDPAAYRWQSEGELACSLSHARALRAFLATSDAYAAIFEDDAILSSALPGFLEAFAASAGGIDVLRLETDNGPLRLRAVPESTNGAFAMYRLFSAGGGAAAYVVSRRAARRILDGEEILANLTDQALFNPLEPLSRSLTVRQLKPALAVQEDRTAPPEQRDLLANSDLEALRRSRGATDGANFWRRAAYNAYDIWQRDIVGALRKLRDRIALGVTKTDVPFASEQLLCEVGMTNQPAGATRATAIRWSAKSAGLVRSDSGDSTLPIGPTQSP